MPIRTKLAVCFIGLTLLAVCLAGAGVRPQAQSSRPNILLLMADDWGWPHAGAYGDKVVKTPTFDRVAREGALFTNAFSASPSCTPSRASLLTGRAVHQLEEGGNLWSALPSKFAVYPDLLEQAGYAVGFAGKGWGPGSIPHSGRKRNPAGDQFKSFEEFFKQLPAGKPFCFWFGSSDPHRPYDKGTGAQSGLKAENVAVPAYLPDTPEVRNDILDYYFEVERFDRDISRIIKTLEDAKQLDNTMVVITGDNGLPFPRAKANVYDAGSHQPFAVRFPGKVKAGSVIDEFVVLTDLAPTFLEAAGLKPPAEMTGRSFLPLPAGQKQIGRDKVFLERERHANVRRGDLSYPVRAVRTKDFLYIRNLRPDRWPAGDPTLYFAVGDFGDIDGGPSKELLLSRRDDPLIGKFFKLAMDKRPAEELYDLKKDPWEINNVADKADYAAARRKLRAELDKWMRDTKDPRAISDDDRWDQYRYFGNPEPPKRN
ncbi:MAG TPA: sulfatase [Blastocatellia bacterium]|nr:sulfatase [Blastocatellia bacterium]HMY74038.1 sulfatase [Blastocatellia bacterium]